MMIRNDSAYPARRVAGGAMFFPMHAQWDAVQGALVAIAAFAGMNRADLQPKLDDVSILLQAGVKDTQISQNLEDLAAVMERGLAALLAAHSGGVDIGVPARALWNEYEKAHAALLALFPDYSA